MGEGIGYGSWWEFTLAYAWVILAVIALFGSLIVTVIYIYQAIRDKWPALTLRKRLSTMAYVVGFIVAIAFFSWRMSMPANF